MNREDRDSAKNSAAPLLSEAFRLKLASQNYDRWAIDLTEDQYLDLILAVRDFSLRAEEVFDRVCVSAAGASDHSMLGRAMEALLTLVNLSSPHKFWLEAGRSTTREDWINLPKRLMAGWVLHVQHDEDGTWLFSHCQIGEIQRMIERDPTMTELADLPPGWIAQRDTPTAPWRRFRLPSFAELLAQAETAKENHPPD